MRVPSLSTCVTVVTASAENGAFVTMGPESGSSAMLKAAAGAAGPPVRPCGPGAAPLPLWALTSTVSATHASAARAPDAARVNLVMTGLLLRKRWMKPYESDGARQAVFADDDVGNDCSTRRVDETGRIDAEELRRRAWHLDPDHPSVSDRHRAVREWKELVRRIRGRIGHRQDL